MTTKQRRNASARYREERWRREDEAGKLLDAVPVLSELCIEIEERTSEDAGPPITHIKRFVLEHSSAHFEIPCSERKCEGGGYDITRDVMHALRRGMTHFEGETFCIGTVNGEPCQRTMHWNATAAYHDQAEVAA